MGNLLENYQERNAGLSPDHIREHVEFLTIKNWQGTALDVGTGAGGWTRYLKRSNKFKKIICTDILDVRDNDNKDLEFFQVDLANQKIPLNDNSVDYIFAIEVLEHIENPRFFMREVYRILSPGGVFIMTTPSCDSLTARLSYLIRGYFPAFCDHDYRGSGHITPITVLDFKRMSSEVGFKKIDLDFSLPGRIPSFKKYWQFFMPFLKGKLWSDCFFAKCIK